MLQPNGEAPEHGTSTSSATEPSTLTTSPRHPLPSTPPPPTRGETIRTPLRESTRPTNLTPSPVAARFANGRPIPTPLLSNNHTSAGTTRAAARTPRPLHSPPPHYDGPRSPREKLDALLAEEGYHAILATTPTQAHPPALSRIPPRGGLQSANLPSYAQLRNVSAPVVSSAGISPPASPVAMPPPSRSNQPDTRPTPPRNLSIDSAASSLSSGASQSFRANAIHASKLSLEPGTAGVPDMAALVSAAGSPEAAFMALWKEKQSATNHNTQLWRLVEKQRLMIIGLQKDLERSLKDKDRYRKKLKDYTSQVPPLPGMPPQRSDTFDSVVERESSQSPAPSDTQDDPAKGSTATKSVEHKLSPLTQETSATQFIPEAQLAHSPSHSSEAQTASNPTSSLNSPTDYSVQPLTFASKGLGLNAIVNEASTTVNTQEEVDARKPESSAPQPAPATPPASSKAPSEGPHLSVTQATPVLGGGEFGAPLEKPVQPLRKAPPAPLNLSRPAKTSAHLHQADPAEDEDSDYDDTLEVEEIPIVDRGRRKTREEDDRVREAMVVKEDETRSKSKKKSKSQPPSETAPEDVQQQPAVARLPPQQFSPSQAGLSLSPRLPPANSLNALLSPTNSDSSTMVQRSIGSPPLMSPGLPTSPRPGDRPMGSPLPRNPKQTLASPPMSPRSDMNGASQPLSRPPRQPIPLPPNTPQSYTSPQALRPEALAQPKQHTSSSDLLKPGPQASPDAETSTGGSDMSSSEHVYRGLVSDQYPGLLLPPNALPSIEVKVSSSRLRPSRFSFLAPKPQEEDPVFHLAIYARSDGKQLWRMEKTIMALPALDAQLKSLSDFQGRLPDRALFGGHAPAKIDARRAALNQYFDVILETPLSEKAAIVVCDFFSTDVIGAQNGDALAPEPAAPQAAPVPRGRQLKEGYLTKRGKNFGGWKARHFILDGPEFRYYEMVGGAHLGTIKLQNAQIGKQSQQQSNQSPQRRDDSEDNQYRHAFLILEPKRKDSTSLVRHVLCAESDEERDAWVEALLQHVDWQEETSPVETAPPAAPRPNVLTKTQGKDGSRPRRKDSPDSEKPNRLQALSYDDTIAAEAPMRGPTHREAKEAYAHSPKTGSFSSESSRHYPSISAPSNGAPIQNAESWGNRALAVPPTAIKDKKRSIFGFGSRRLEQAPEQSLGQQQHAYDRVIQQNRNVFGIPLAEAVEYTQPIGLRDPLPAVVFRSLEYLRAKKAMNEEGIFRLSGSNIVIRGLRERFNTEGDVKLLDGQYYDIHAVASLLKLYLRELPASILTRELHLDFLKVLDMDERSKKIQTFNVLVHKLPRVNFELIRHMSSFLMEIVENAGMNKMTVRNVGIVFAPTLNIPAPLISFFVTDYPDIFGVPIDEANSPIHEIRQSTSQGGDEVRSPRHQMFSDIPTPAYNETSFQQHYDRPPSSFPMGSAPSYPPPQAPQQQQQQQQPQYAGYDNGGFIPLRPSYEAPAAYEQQYQSAEGFGSLNGAVQSGGAREQRQRRRESGMLLMNMGMGQRKGSNGSNPPRLRDDPRTNPLLIREETAFD